MGRLDTVCCGCSSRHRGGPTPGARALSVPTIFGLHMAIKQGVAVPLWRTDTMGSTVTVRYRDRGGSFKATAVSPTGKWRVVLPAADASLNGTGVSITDLSGNDPEQGLSIVIIPVQGLMIFFVVWWLWRWHGRWLAPSVYSQVYSRCHVQLLTTPPPSPLLCCTG